MEHLATIQAALSAVSDQHEFAVAAPARAPGPLPGMTRDTVVIGPENRDFAWQDPATIWERIVSKAREQATEPAERVAEALASLKRLPVKARAEEAAAPAAAATRTAAKSAPTAGALITSVLSTPKEDSTAPRPPAPGR